MKFMNVGKNDLAFGKTFVCVALTEKGVEALKGVLDEKPSEAESRLIKIWKSSDDPFSIKVHVTDEEFKDQIKKVSDKTAEKLGRLQRRYNVELQVEILKKQMTITNVTLAMYQSIAKHGGNFKDVKIIEEKNGKV